MRRPTPLPAPEQDPAAAKATADEVDASTVRRVDPPRRGEDAGAAADPVEDADATAPLTPLWVGSSERAPMSTVTEATPGSTPEAAEDADAIGVLGGDVQPRITPGLDAGRHAVMDEGIHLLGFLGPHVIGHIETLDLARDLAVEHRGVETRHPADARTTVNEVVPGGLHIVAHGRHDAQSGYDDTSFH